jgi:osmotically-inducible protein OsmY
MPQSLADDVVRSNVKTALAAVPGLEGSSVDVSVSKGVVTLSGKVSGAGQRAQVLQYVSRVQGVQSIVDHLKVA